jgi:hypothetical protein
MWVAHLHGGAGFHERHGGAEEAREQLPVEVHARRPGDVRELEHDAVESPTGQSLRLPTPSPL